MASFWNVLTGKKPQTQHEIHPNEFHPADSGDTAPTTSFTTQSHFDPSNASDVSSFLTPAFLDPAALHPLAGLEQGLSYLDLEDTALSSLPGSRTALPSRGWSDDLCYGTGTTYLLALSLGGAWGLAEGLRRTPPGASGKLQLNYVLNGMTRRGPFLGNSAGVLAMVYNGINSTIGYARGKHDAANSVVSGMIAGAIFKSTRGVKPMLWSASLVGAAAGAWTVGSRVVMVAGEN